MSSGLNWSNEVCWCFFHYRKIQPLFAALGTAEFVVDVCKGAVLTVSDLDDMGVGTPGTISDDLVFISGVLGYLLIQVFYFKWHLLASLQLWNSFYCLTITCLSLRVTWKLIKSSLFSAANSCWSLTNAMVPFRRNSPWFWGAVRHGDWAGANLGHY